MPKTFIVNTTEYGSYYMGKQIMLLHPKMAQLISGIGNKNEEVDNYYYNKLEYLNSHNQLDGVSDISFSSLTPEDVELQLANTPQVVFEVTDACNLKCTYCAYGEMYDGYDARENKELPIEKAIKLIDYLVEKWNSTLNTSSQRQVFFTFYGGEPLLSMKLIKAIVEYVKQLNCPSRLFSFGMTTNGLLLHKYMNFLAENEFRITISLDGDENNTAYRVDHNNVPAYKRIEKNIHLLRDKYSEFFNSYVNFNAVLHNKNSIEAIYRYFKERYDKTPSIGELSYMGVKEKSRELFMKTYRNARESLLQSEHYTEVEKGLFMTTGDYQSLVGFLYQRSGFVYKNYNELIYDTPNTRYIPTGTCLPFSKKIFITVNGKLLPCERISQQYALGEITDTKIILDYQKIADKYNGYYASLYKQCKHCRNTTFCRQCIFNLKNLDKKPICEGFMNDDNIKQYAQTQLEFLINHRNDYTKIMKEVTIE